MIQFTPPDETQWPAAQKIDEFGRSAGNRSRRGSQHRPAHRHDRTDWRRPRSSDGPPVTEAPTSPDTTPTEPVPPTP